MVRASRYDVVIIGAGINGAGIARDAAMRGLSVLLIEKGEWAPGRPARPRGSFTAVCAISNISSLAWCTSHSASARLYCGLLQISSRPLAITIPIYKQSKRGRLTIRAGMILYDLLSWGKSLARHQMLSLDETLERWPGLNPESLVASALYYDAQVEFPERLVLANVQSARDFGAEVLTHTRVTNLAVENAKVSGVEFESEDGQKQFAEGEVGYQCGRAVD